MTTIKKSKSRTKSKNSSAKVIQLNIFQQAEQSESDKLINGLWSVLKSSLWLNREFTKTETDQLKTLIAGHLHNSKNSKKSFTDLIERVCLVKRYLARKPGRYISKPQDWLNVHYPNGLIGTASWLGRVNEIRRDVPDYNQGINTLAIAILKYLDSPESKVVTRYRKMLIEQKQFDLLQIFYNTIINLQYK